MNPQFAQWLSEFTPGAAGIWTGILMFAGWMMREYRETRKLSADDRLARREGYEKQVQLLAGENRALATDQRALREEYDKYRRLCEAETDQLRQQVIKLEFEIAGLRRRAAEVGVQLAGISTGDPLAIAGLIAEFSTGEAE